MNDLPLIDIDQYSWEVKVTVWRKVENYKLDEPTVHHRVTRSSLIRAQQMQLKLYDQMKGQSPDEQQAIEAI